MKFKYPPYPRDLRFNPPAPSTLYFAATLVPLIGVKYSM
jgi:hypothetical protein